MVLLLNVSWSLLDPIILLSLLTVSWGVFHYIYNLWFHPLSYLPGPFFSRMSPWPSAYHAHKGDRHLWIERCFNKYGKMLADYKKPSAHVRKATRSA
jgi:hypothetical protein